MTKTVTTLLLGALLFPAAAEAKKINLKQVRAVAQRTAKRDCEDSATQRLIRKLAFNHCRQAVVEPYDCQYGPPIVKVDVASCDGKWILDTPLIDSKKVMVCWWSPNRARFYQSHGAIRVKSGRTHRCHVVTDDGVPASASLFVKSWTP